MIENAVNEILELNKVFYQDIAKDFSRTRQSPWKGWELVVPYLPEMETIKVLDVACGNARFYPFLLKNTKKLIEYTGLDVTTELLDEARTKYPQIKLLKYDVISDMKSFNHKYDFIVAFGIAHHIPSIELREEWFLSLGKLLNEKGVLIVTLWDYIKTVTDEVKNKIVETEKIPVNKNEIDEGDFFLWWGSNKESIRYCHDYEDSEVESIVKKLEGTDINLIARFKADGKDNNLNTYLVFRRD